MVFWEQNRVQFQELQKLSSYKSLGIIAVLQQTSFNSSTEQHSEVLTSAGPEMKCHSRVHDSVLLFTLWIKLRNWDLKKRKYLKHHPLPIPSLPRRATRTKTDGNEDVQHTDKQKEDGFYMIYQSSSEIQHWRAVDSVNIINNEI